MAASAHRVVWRGSRAARHLGAEAVADIEDRIGPINDILADLPFGTHGGHLHINVERMPSVPVRRFLTRLKRLSSTATTDTDLTRWCAGSSRSASSWTCSATPTTKSTTGRSDRQRLLDVRRHVRISALEVPPIPGMWETRQPSSCTCHLLDCLCAGAASLSQYHSRADRPTSARPSRPDRRIRQPGSDTFGGLEAIDLDNARTRTAGVVVPPLICRGCRRAWLGTEGLSADGR